MKSALVFLSYLMTLININCLNSFTQEMLTLTKNISCIKYIPAYQVLAVADTNNDTDFYYIATSPAVKVRTLLTSSPVVTMLTLSDRATLILVERNKISALNTVMSNQTLEYIFLMENIQTAIPWGDQILVQMRFLNNYYVCSLDATFTSLRCIPQSFSFSSYSTNFIKSHPYSFNSSTIALKPTLKSISHLNIKTGFQQINLTVPSNATDIIFSTLTLNTYIFTATKSIHLVSFPASGLFSRCFKMDFDPKIMKQSTISLKQDVFWYITDLGAVKGRDFASFNLVYLFNITKAVELQTIDINQDIVVRTSDNIIYILRTLPYSGKNVKLEFFVLCGEPATTGTYDMTLSTVNGTNTSNLSFTTNNNVTQPSISNITGNTSTINSTDNTTINLTTNFTTNYSVNLTSSNTTTNQTSSENSTLFYSNTTQTSNLQPETIQLANSSDTTIQKQKPTQEFLLAEIQARQIFYCIENCKTCLNETTCHICKSGFYLVQHNTCQPEASITLFFTLITAPYSGLVLNLVLMDFLDEFWFFEHHHFNYSKNLQKIFSLVGSLNRNKIIPPIFKIFLKDRVANLNLRKISISNYLNYTKITYQKAENTDVYFVATISGMFIWAYILILLMFVACYFLNFILSSQFQIHVLDKFSCKGAIFFHLFSPFVQFVSFHAFSQVGIFFAFNSFDKINLITAIVFLQMILMFAFAGFPIFFNMNEARKVKEFYGQKQNLAQYMISIAMRHGKFLMIGFVNGYFQNYTIQCLSLLLIYFFEATRIKKQMKKCQSKLFKAPLFFKLIMKVLSFFFIVNSLWIHLESQSLEYIPILQINQQIFIIAIWTWAIGDMIFKIIQNLVIGLRKVRLKIQSCFKEQKEPLKVKSIKLVSKIKTKKLQKVSDEDISDLQVTGLQKKVNNEGPEFLWNQNRKHIKRYNFRKNDVSNLLTASKPRERLKIQRTK